MSHLQSSVRAVLLCGISVALVVGLAGCSMQTGGTNATAQGLALSGRVHGGQQPVSASKVYLYAASTSNYSGNAVSLLGGSGYVTTDAAGNFSITGTYTCPAGAYVYALALGGNPGIGTSVNNPYLGLMTGLGACSSLTPSTVISINEVTTVASVYALSQFMSSETQIGTSATNLLGLKNAFLTIPNLVNTSTGNSQTSTPAGNGIVPQAEINSLANALAACVNTSGAGTPCASLMTAAGVTSGSGVPVDTIQAALGIAAHPANNAATIYGLSTTNAPFQPTLASPPADWTVSVVYSGGGIGQIQQQGLNIDASANVWAGNFFSGTATEMSPTGAFLSPGNGYNDAEIAKENGLGIDLTGNVWLAGSRATGNTYASVKKFAANGTVLSGATGFSNACLGTGTTNLAIDPSNNVWTFVGNSPARLCKLNNAGVLVSPTTGFTGGGLPGASTGLAIEPSGNIWVTGFINNSGVYSAALAKFDTNGVAISPSTGFPASPVSNYGSGISLDHAGNAWVGGAQVVNGSIISGAIQKYSSAGILLSPSTGYAPGAYVNWTAVDGLGHVWGNAGYLTGSNSALVELANDGTMLSPAIGFAVLGGGLSGAIDPSGNIWEGGIDTIVETIGLAAPVLTPLSVATANNVLGMRP